MRGSGIVMAATSFLYASGAIAADIDLTELKKVEYTSMSPTWSVVGSLSPTYTANALFSRDDRRGDFYYEPDVSLRLDGKLAPDLSYRIFARAQFEAFSREHDGNAAIARLGARLTKNLYGWRISATYENRYDYDGVFRDLAFTSHDITGAIARDFNIANVTLSPLLQLTYRFSDLAEARRWRFDALVGIEVELNSKWSIVSTPFFEAFWFTDGLNRDREDQIYSASLGLKYNIASNVSLTTNVIYEARNSNVALRHYRDWMIGPRLDFAF
ncbi:outer membrane beta-barrel protein [Tardiphaga sp. 813_E8_N1_3]|uniref:outer membrane beta-barrel protein n=1 Tax=Tardiphaga sp. 813_E8_N1_3 TaxID=3240760 RepID=UPI003F2680BA